MSLVLYNSLTKRDEKFEPIEAGKVRMYTCGPTVYGRPHIGNYSSFLMADLLRRWLEVSGYEVRQVKNITDVGHLVADQDEGEDKIEKQAKEEKTDPLAIARKYTEQYLGDEKLLNMLEPFARPRATETIPEMIAIIEKLVKNGNAYETSDGVYFAVESFPAYGKLSGNTLENLSVGARVEVKEEKRHPADFALWKKTVEENAHHILRWQSPWGEGFPGWHIECSAMAKKLLGDQLDIHTGGEDNIFPHHECEIAQSECSGAAPFVRVWLHKRRIEIALNDTDDAKKMSKSLGNVLVLPNILASGYDALDLRYYLLSVHYRTKLKFTWRGLDDAKKARQRILQWIEEISDERLVKKENEVTKGAAVVEGVKKFTEEFAAAMDSDLNTPAALAVLFDVMSWSRQQDFTDEAHKALKKLIEIAKQTFGCFEPYVQNIPEEVSQLVLLREEARREKNFAESDRLRDEVLKLGFLVKDTPEGTKVQKV